MEPRDDIEELRQVIGRAIDAAGHARYLAQAIERRTAYKTDARVLAVRLLGVRKNLEACETAFEKVWGGIA